MALLLRDVEEGKGVQISLGGRIYGFEGTGLEKEGENKVTRDKRQTRRGADTTVQVTSVVVSRGDQVLTSRDSSRLPLQENFRRRLNWKNWEQCEWCFGVTMEPSSSGGSSAPHASNRIVWQSGARQGLKNKCGDAVTSVQAR